MPLPIREAHDLVLERRTVTGTDAVNLAVVERTTIDIGAHEIAHTIVRVQQPASNLIAQSAGRDEREWYWRRIAQLFREQARFHGPIEIDAVPMQPRRRAGLQPSHHESARPDRLCQLARRRLAVTSGSMLLGPDMKPAVEKRPRGDNKRLALIAIAVFHHKSDHALVLNEDSTRGANQPRDVGFAIDRVGDPRGVPALVRLRSRRPHRWTAASVEQLELNARGVDGAPHEAAKRVDLADEMSLGRPSDGRVARHVGHGVTRHRAQPDAAPETRGGVRSLDTCMPRADDNHIETHSQAVTATGQRDRETKGFSSSAFSATL